MTSDHARYSVHGVTIVSQVPLPDLPPAPNHDGDLVHAVSISCREPTPVADAAPPGEVIADNVIAGRRWYIASRDEQAVRLRMPRLAEFVVSTDLTSVVCHPDPTLDPGLLPIVVSGNVIAFVLALRGHAVLHASAVEIDGSAVAVAGYSHGGKSTLAALLCARGAALVTDDLLHIDPGSPAICHRGGRRLRLRPAAGAIAEAFPPEARRATADGRVAVRPATSDRERLPLRAILTLQRSSTSSVAVRRLRGASAALPLLRAPRTTGWHEEAPIRRHFDAVAQVARTVPVYAVDLPTAHPLDSTLVDSVLTGLNLDLRGGDARQRTALR